MNNRTPDSHYPWTKKWGAGHARTYEGMMIALPPQEWAIFRDGQRGGVRGSLAGGGGIGVAGQVSAEPSRPEEAAAETNQRQEESSCRHRPPLGSAKST